MKLKHFKQLQHVLFYFLLSFILAFFSNCSQSKIKVAQGALDLRSWDFNARGSIDLDGDWEFYWNCQLKSHPNTCKSKPDGYISVPGIWNQYVVDNNKIDGKGFASYRLKLFVQDLDRDYSVKLLDMATSYNLWINGEKILSNGFAGITAEETRPRFLPAVYRIGKLQHENEIVVEISNYNHYKGGFWESITLGDSANLAMYRENKIWLDVFLCGSISIMIVYHFGLYALRRKDISTVYFAVFCFLVMLRLSVTGERILFYKFPNFDWELGNKIEYGTFYLTIPSFEMFLRSVFPKEFHKIVGRIIIGMVSFLLALLIFTDISVYSHTALPWEIMIIFICIYAIVSLVISTKRKMDGAFASLIGLMFLIVTVVNDILYANNVINTSFMLPYGLFLFIFFQSFLISLRFSRAFLAVELLSDDLLKINQSYSRFVPTEFLSLLNKKSIIDVELGDQIQKEMTIMFSDIRGFTSLSETMTPQENFNFINSYLRVMEPVITQYNGFIDKYIGDAIMALFPTNPEDALDASIIMLKELNRYNQNRSKSGYKPISIGIGINTGNLMLGTIGSTVRMDGTVISDAVNLAARIESLTKEFKIPLIISESSYQLIRNKKKFNLREIDRVIVKGKTHPTVIYECFDVDSPELIESKVNIMKDYDSAMNEFHNKNYEKASSCFKHCLKKCPTDPIVKEYINRCEEMALHKA